MTKKSKSLLGAVISMFAVIAIFAELIFSAQVSYANGIATGGGGDRPGALNQVLNAQNFKCQDLQQTLNKLGVVAFTFQDAGDLFYAKNFVANARFNVGLDQKRVTAYAESLDVPDCELGYVVRDKDYSSPTAEFKAFVAKTSCQNGEVVRFVDKISDKSVQVPYLCVNGEWVILNHTK